MAIDFEAIVMPSEVLPSTKACLSDAEWGRTGADESQKIALGRCTVSASTLQRFDVLNTTGEHVEAPDV